MRYSQMFPKTLRQAPAGAEAVNHQLLVRAGFIDQLMAGSWTLLPLGFRVMQKIQAIIREELNETGAQEMLMPLLHPREIWDQTGRWSDPDVKEIMYQFKDEHGKEYCLSFTHEEIVMNLLGKYISSYKDLPIKIYHFSTKFRNEARAKSGILRGREFMMKDLYSAHTSLEDLEKYFAQVRTAYKKIYQRMGLDVKVVDAHGGVFTEHFTQEFQVPAEVGEDVIMACDACDYAINTELYKESDGQKCPRCQGNLTEVRSIEVGHIFTLGTKYAKNMNVMYQDESGQKQDLWFASYGIGVSRLIGTLVELFHDDKGIIWPESVAPFQYHLIGLDLALPEVKEQAEKVYQQLLDQGKEVLFDDRVDVGAGQKFADADLIGLPVRLVVSKKTGNQIEVKKRTESDSRLQDSL